MKIITETVHDEDYHRNVVVRTKLDIYVFIIFVNY